MFSLMTVLALLGGAIYLMARWLKRDSRTAAINAVAHLRAILGLQTMADLQRAAADAVCRSAPVSVAARHLPNDILVLLHPDDHQQIGELSADFSNGVVSLLYATIKNGARDGHLPYKLVGDLRVRLKADVRVARGTVAVVSAVAERTRLTSSKDEGDPGSAGADKSRWLLEMNLGGERVPLRGTLVVGRGVDVDVRIGGDGVSREHARLRCRGMEILLQDLDTANGTWVNGERTTDGRLKVGDRVRFGDGPTAVIELSPRARQTIYHSTEPFSRRNPPKTPQAR